MESFFTFVLFDNRVPIDPDVFSRVFYHIYNDHNLIPANLQYRSVPGIDSEKKKILCLLGQTLGLSFESGGSSNTDDESISSSLPSELPSLYVTSNSAIKQRDNRFLLYLKKDDDTFKTLEKKRPIKIHLKDLPYKIIEAYLILQKIFCNEDIEIDIIDPYIKPKFILSLYEEIKKNNAKHLELRYHYCRPFDPRKGLNRYIGKVAKDLLETIKTLNQHELKKEFKENGVDNMQASNIFINHYLLKEEILDRILPYVRREASSGDIYLRTIGEIWHHRFIVFKTPLFRVSFESSHSFISKEGRLEDIERHHFRICDVNDAFSFLRLEAHGAGASKYWQTPDTRHFLKI